MFLAGDLASQIRYQARYRLTKCQDYLAGYSMDLAVLFVSFFSLHIFYSSKYKYFLVSLVPVFVSCLKSAPHHKLG
jgi:hypothetical protein